MAERALWGMEPRKRGKLKPMRAYAALLAGLLRIHPHNIAVAVFTVALAALSFAQSGAVPDTVAWRDVSAVCITIIGFFAATMITGFRKEQKLIRSALLRLAMAIRDNDKKHLYEVITDLSEGD